MIFCLDVNETHYKKKEILHQASPRAAAIVFRISFSFFFLPFLPVSIPTVSQQPNRSWKENIFPKQIQKSVKKITNKKNKRNKRGKKYTFLRLSKTSGFDSPSSGNQRGHRRSPRVGKGERERETSTSLNFSRSRNHLKKRRRIYKRRCHPIPSPLIKEKLFKPGFDASTAKFVKRLKF